MIKIDQTKHIQPVQKTEQQVQQVTQKSSQAASYVQQSEISTTTQAVQQAFNTLAQHGEVDLDKVAQVKVALSRGELQLDDDTLAQAILDFHRK
jgi:negative regulator of flagellin synthesis FlgM